MADNGSAGLRFAPCVFMAEDEYQIVFVTYEPGMAWVRVGGQEYADAEAGLMRWHDTAHRVCVPRAALDEAGAYTVRFAAMQTRAPYYPRHAQPLERTYRFRPLGPGEPVRLRYIADTHGRVEEPVRYARAMGAGLLVLGGDVADHNSSAEDLYVHLRINDALTGGEEPVLFSRGNHDTRGPAAHLLRAYMPVCGGRTYYEFSTGDLWGVVLDAGEDKPDGREEYGDTVCFAPYRRAQTAFLRRLRDEGRWRSARHRIAVCHVPFSMVQDPPFDIEQDVYRDWVRLLNDMEVELLLCGHMHFARTVRPGDEWDAWGQRFTTVIGSGLEDGVSAGALVELGEGVRAAFYDSKGNAGCETWGTW